ncbi:hypothetical protein HYW35_03755 [Candidatus Saccharibacteria bacterium]|nr:hypothetical protein [Candidatus Saccharibacteria bacterium]
MKHKDMAVLITVAVITGFISLIMASIFFSVPQTRSSKVPVVDTITTSLPDIKNEPVYQSIFNSKALDPAQPVQIGNTQNNTPFNSRGR